MRVCVCLGIDIIYEYIRVCLFVHREHSEVSVCVGVCVCVCV